MPRTISEALRVPPQRLDRQGTFDGFVDIDAQLYVDPHLLSSSSAPEMAGSYKLFQKHFRDVVHLLKSSQARGDPSWRVAVKHLTFGERPAAALGYSLTTTSGNAIGPELAERLTDTAVHIIRAGIEDPTIFELIGLIEEGIGADRISDMTVSIIWPLLLRFTQRVAKRVRAKVKPHRYGGTTYSIPIDQTTGRILILLPKDILAALPIAHDWSDVDLVCADNAALRARVNPIIGRTWLHATRRVRKRDLKDAVLRNPGLLTDLIALYLRKHRTPYDFADDPKGEVNWHHIALRFAAAHPLDLSPYGPVTGLSLLPLVVQICNHFRTLLQDNGLSELLYDRRRTLKPERAAHLLFYGVADAYCQANNLDLSPEANAGRGSVDFKVSRGSSAKVNVEVKYSSNTHLQRGWDAQLPTYNAAERTQYSIYLIIQTTESTRVIDRIANSAREHRTARRRTPEVIVADGRLKPSASHL